MTDHFGTKYKTTRKERLKALRDRLAWLDRKLLSTDGTHMVNSYLQAEREATHWAIETLSALVECHSLKWAIEQEQRKRAEDVQDQARQEIGR